MINKLSIKYNIDIKKAAILFIFIIIVTLIIGIVFYDIGNFESTENVVINETGNNITYVEGENELNILNNNGEIIHTFNSGESINIYNAGSYQIMNEDEDVIKNILISEYENINSSFNVDNEERIQATDDIIFNYNSTDSEIVEYVWDFGDNSDLIITSEEKISYSYDEKGEYLVELTIVDEDNNINTTDKIINVKPNELKASAFVNNDSGFTTTEFEFNATKSLSADEDIEAYVWDFDDGTKSEGETVTHVYDEPGLYIVELEVIDTHSKTDTYNIIIQVEGTSIETEIIANETQKFVNKDFEYNIITANSMGTSIDSYKWNLGDNTTIMNQYDVIHAYNESGEYTVELIITGEDGTKNADSISIDVNKKFIDAKVNANKTEKEVNKTFELSGSDSIVEGTSIASYEWDLGDNNTETGEIIEHSYNETGDYMVNLTITGEDGNESTDSINLTVNSGLDAQINVDETKKSVGDEFKFSGSESSANKTNIQSYEWNFGDETIKTGEQVSKIYIEPEIYVVGLTVIGEDGTKDTDTINIEVTD